MKVFEIEIKDSVKDILGQGKIEGALYFLPQVQLDRKQYLEVNEILELLGGKWNRGKKAHVFESEEKSQELFDALQSGSVIDKVKTFQFFETPKEVVERMIELAELQDGMSILEPSAGHGAIADFLPRENLVLCEVDSEKVEVLKGKGYSVNGDDYLTTDLGQFDRIIMNPPFSGNQDIDHVTKAFGDLNEIGILVSVVSPGFTFKTDKKSMAFRELVEEHGTWEKLPENSFKESGTSVRTVLVKLVK